MCMIAFRPVAPGKRGGANIPHEVIDLAMNRHPDGFGVAWREFGADGKPTLKVEKFGPSGRKHFRRALKRVDRSGAEYVAHFRYATQGPKVQGLAHPYEYDDPTEGRVLVFHNGIINIKADKSESDTQVFVREVLAKLPSGWWRDPALRYLVTAAIDWSKLVVMTATETINLHDSRGDWDGGIWYSSAHKARWSDKGGSWESTGVGSSVWVPDKGKAAGVKVGETVTTVTAGSLVPYGGNVAGSAEASYAAFASGLADKPFIPASNHHAYGLRHAGHNVSEVIPIDRSKDGDWEQSVICDSCGTMGDAYCIDGQVWIDMAHFDPQGRLTNLEDEAGPAADNEEQAVLDAEMDEDALEDEAVVARVRALVQVH